MSILETLKNGYPIYLNPFGTLQTNKKEKKQKSLKSIELFRKRKGKNTELLNQIQKDFKLTKSDAKKALQAYSLIIAKNLKNHSIVTIPQVGIISINDKGKYVLKSFINGNGKRKKKKNSRKNKTKKRLEKITALAISNKAISTENKIFPKISEEINEVNASSDTTKENEKAKINQELFEEVNELERIEYDLPDKDDLKEVLKDHFYQEDHENIINEKVFSEKEKSSSHLESPSYGHFTSESKFRPWIIGILCTLGFIILVCLGLKFLSQPSSDIKNSTGEIGLITPNKEQLRLESPQATEEVSSLDNTEKCIIITGTFSQIYNEEHMRNQIISHGYSPYTEQINSMTRVGIEIDCSIDNMDEILNEVRNNIAPKAWYLYPPN